MRNRLSHGLLDLEELGCDIADRLIHVLLTLGAIRLQEEASEAQ